MMHVPEKPEQVIGFNIKTVHLQALFITLASAAAGFTLILVVHSEIGIAFTVWRFVSAVLLYFFLIIMHELLHLIGFVWWGKCKKRDLVYGINLEIGAAYAGTKKAMPNKAMKKALMLPFWVTGVLPFFAGIWLNSAGLMLVSAFLIGGAAGDLSMYAQLKKIPGNAFIVDDITEPKLYVYSKKPRQK